MRKSGDGPIWITVTKIERCKCGIGIEAPKSVAIEREEIIRDEAAADIGGEHV